MKAIKKSSTQKNTSDKQVKPYKTFYNVGYYYFFEDCNFTGMGFTLLGDDKYVLGID